MTDYKSTIDDKTQDSLISAVSSIAERPVSSDFLIFVEEIKSRFGPSLDAILLYGSCLRSQTIGDGVVDFYVVVDNYNKAYQEKYLCYFNECLPPNVFYLEVSAQERVFRSKYAVISMEEFEKGNQYWFHSYLWARFAQPTRLLYARDKILRNRIYSSLANAVIAFLTPTINALGSCTVTIEEIWVKGLMFTYAAEIRAEKEIRARQLAEINLDDYKYLTEHALPRLTRILKKIPQGNQLQKGDYYQCLVDECYRKRALRCWWLRRWQGRVLSVLRLAKATFTFRDCIDYAAWKIERHTGVCIEVTSKLRRHPILFGFKVFWKLFRRGVLR
tara:strand:+ start:16258 stop:17250 length:993 start_codon:yes stop_codon:yes gene_type:complete